jgi:hypothetical protein
MWVLVGPTDPMVKLEKRCTRIGVVIEPSRAEY